MTKRLATVLVALAALPAVLWAGAVVVPHAFTNGAVADADQVNANFTALAAQVNDNDARLDAAEADRVLTGVIYQPSATGYYSASFPALFGVPPVFLAQVLEPDASGHSGGRLVRRSRSGFSVALATLNTYRSTYATQGGLAWVALPPGTRTSAGGKKLVAGVYDNRVTACSTMCPVTFPAGSFTTPPVVVGYIDESIDDGGAMYFVVETTTATGFTFTARWNNVFYPSENIHWVAVEAGLHQFDGLTVAAGIHTPTVYNGQFNMTASAADFTNPPAVILTANRIGGSSTGSHARNVSDPWSTKQTVKYETYADAANGVPARLNWVAFDEH